MKKSLKWLYAILIINIILLYSVLSIGLNPEIYCDEFTSLKVHNYVDLKESQLMVISKHIVGYLAGEFPELSYFMANNSDFFNTREKMHMADVKNLFNLGINALTIHVVLLFIFVMLELRSNGNLKELSKSYIVSIGMLLIFFVLYKNLDFNNAFNSFHHIFFNNDLWILNPETDLLIRIMPLQFFVNMTKRIAIKFLTIFLFSGLVSLFFQFFANKFKLSANHSN